MGEQIPADKHLVLLSKLCGKYLCPEQPLAREPDFGFIHL